MRRLPTRLLALIVAAMLLAPASALMEVVYFCKMSGAIGSRCRCAHPNEPPSADSYGPTADRPDCCEARLTGGMNVVASASGLPAGVGPAVLAREMTIAELIERGQPGIVVGQAVARGPPHTGPPIYLEHCSLLS